METAPGLISSTSVGGKLKLPDIDFNGKDTFETSEFGEDESKENVDIISEVPNESIEKNTVLPKEAFKKFEGKQWDQNQDFRDIIAKKRVAKGGFVQNQKEYEIDGQTVMVNENETILQKFHRLQFEVKNFLTEVSDKKAEKSDEAKSDKAIDPSNIAEELSLLQANLQRVMTDDSAQAILNPQYDLKQAASAQNGISKKLLAELKKYESKPTAAIEKETVSNNSVTYELYYSPEQKKQMQAEKKLEIWKRD